MRYNPLMGDVTTTQSTTIESDLPCAHCHYNLRTQPADGRCPECAQTVAESVEHHRRDGMMRYRRIMWGALLLLFNSVPSSITKAAMESLIPPWPANKVGHQLAIAVSDCLQAGMVLAGIIILVTSPPLRGRFSRAAIALGIANLVMMACQQAVYLWYYAQPAAVGPWWVNAATYSGAVKTLVLASLVALGPVFVASLRPPGKRTFVFFGAAFLSLPMLVLSATTMAHFILSITAFWGWPALADLFPGFMSRYIPILESMAPPATGGFAILWCAVAIAAWRARRPEPNIPTP